MGMTAAQFKELRKEIESCERPLIFFDSDPDGTASYLLVYRHIQKGRGVMVKNCPEVGVQFLRKVEEYCPDKVIILDKPMVSQDFIDGAGVPVVWVDHHPILDLKNLKYFNPKFKGDSVYPTSYIVYKAIGGPIWLAMVGIIGDWYLPEFKDEFMEKYPDLLPKRVKTPPQALFNSRIGEFIKMVSFILKGKTGEAMKCIKILSRIEDPYEVLDQTTPRGRYVYRNYFHFKKEYDLLLKEASAKKTRDKILFYRYTANRNSFTKELSNEMLYRFPNKIIMIGREKSGEMKLSLRSSDINIAKVLEAALQGVEGYGGGHDHACGAVVKLSDFDRFYEAFSDGIKKASNSQRKI